MIHVGAEEWLVVDSCVDEHNQVVALAYLSALGVDTSRQVVRVVATHWHDDHVGGIARVLASADGAPFCCSEALRPQEFLALVEALAARSMITRSGVSEFAAVIETLKRRKHTGHRFPTPQFALQDRTLWHRSSGPVELRGRLNALSPSDGALVLAQRALAAEFPLVSKPNRAIAAPEPNDTAVVLWLQVGTCVALLGADLEETKRNNTGWTVIVDTAEVPGAPASIFKVPHHGSRNADQPRVWDEILVEDPFAILTPFVQGDTSLPTDRDRLRICSHTSRAWITSGVRRDHKQRSRPVERTLKELGVRVTNADPPMGHIRLRQVATSANHWSVELFGAAQPLCDAVREGTKGKRRRHRRRGRRRG